MSRDDQGASRPNQPRPFDHSLHLMTLAGIQIRLDSSLLIIFALIVYSLGASVFPDWHRDWTFAMTWLTALSAGVLFFASVLLHELSHSLVARHYGIPVPRITLFLFGGMAEIEKEPETPKTEFLIAIAGPVASLCLGLAFAITGGLLAGPDFAARLAEDQAAALAALPPLATLSFWLGPINILLGLFNLVPGFPLDGGRVLRATMWWLLGDLHRATRIATDTGRLFGWCLMILGTLQALSGALLQGLWLLMIGWFLSHSATASYRELVMREMLRGVTVRDLMRSQFETVAVNRTVADFIDRQLLQNPQILWPVTEDGQLVGLATLEDVKDVPIEDRGHTVIGQVMRTDLSRLTLHPDMDANLAMSVLSLHNSPLAVVEGNKVIGLLSQFDASKWLLLHKR